MAELYEASITRLVEFFRQHGTAVMLFQTNDILVAEGLKATKGRFYYVKKKFLRGDYGRPGELHKRKRDNSK